MSWAWFTGLFDSYNRVARIYPALLALAPVIISIAVSNPKLVENIPDGLSTLVVVAAVTYLLASLARSRGKATEARLLTKWGGWPSTQLLRHRDGGIDSVTKARYHAALSDLCPDLRFPTINEERLDPRRADDIYRSATKRLIEARRDPQYILLHHENAAYGFRRNLRGLKPIAILVAVVAVAVTAGNWLALTPAWSLASLVYTAGEYPQLPWLCLFDVSCCVLVVLVVDDNFVAQAAREYAEALLRTLDRPAPALGGQTTSA